MKSNVDMNKKIKNIFDSAESINEVRVSPFFKEKVMLKIRSASEDIQEATWSWFTPKLQLATLVCIVALNVMAFSIVHEKTYDENLSNFAESYGLSTSTANSIIN